MKHLKLSWLVLACIGICGCAYQNKALAPEKHTVPFEHHQVLALENLYTREIAYCYANAEFSAEECAAELEQKGFVQLTEIPKVTAPRDFLSTGTYPTRRWREGDLVPRW